MGQIEMRRCWSSVARAALATTLIACVGACSDEPDPLIEFRLVRQDSAPGLERVELDGEVFYLEPASVISDADLSDVLASPQGDRLMLLLEIAPAASERMTRTTRENIGRRMAFLLDSHVRSAPIITDSVGSPLRTVVEVDGPERERLMERIRERWPVRLPEAGT